VIPFLYDKSYITDNGALHRVGPRAKCPSCPPLSCTVHITGSYEEKVYYYIVCNINGDGNSVTIYASVKNDNTL